MKNSFDKLFAADVMTKHRRVEATLNFEPVDRAALLEQLSYNSGVVAMYTGKAIKGFEYTVDDICQVIRATVDLVMPPLEPCGTDRVTTEDGFVYQNDNWTRWHVSRPFDDEVGARDWLREVTRRKRETPLDLGVAKREHRQRMNEIQQKIGDTVILDIVFTGFCDAYDRMGLELFSYFYADYPEVFAEYMRVGVECEVARIHAVADPALTPVVLVAEDFSSKFGLLFSPTFLREHHYPAIARVTEAWHEHGLKVLYHSDGNWKSAIPDLKAAGVDGFYCLEPNAGMDIVELKGRWPEMTWAGGIDGVDLMERGTPEQVTAEVRRHILETDVFNTGGMFVATSSEINPPIPPENFKAMIETVGNLTNPRFPEITDKF